MVSPKIALFVFFGGIVVAFIAYRFRYLILHWQSPSLRERTLQEDILKLVYHVQSGNRSVGFDALCGALKVKPRKMLHLLNNMAQAQLIRIANDSILLTEEGQAYALQIVRTHRLWEKFLAEKTGIHQSEWHDRAERKEHQLSAEQTEQLYEELGRPRFDPHGDPIPTTTGEMVKQKGKTLPDAPVGVPVKIVHIEDEPNVVYQQILKEKLHMGSHLQVLASTDQRVSFISEGQEHNLSTIAASNVTVRELSKSEQYEENFVRLSSLKEGEQASIEGLSSECRGATRRRLLDLGFVKGAVIKAELDSPLKNPRGYRIKNTLIALRKDQADFVLITKNEDHGNDG